MCFCSEESCDNQIILGIPQVSHNTKCIGQFVFVACIVIVLVIIVCLYSVIVIVILYIEGLSRQLAFTWTSFFGVD